MSAAPVPPDGEPNEDVARALDAEAADAMATNPDYAEGFRRAAAFVRRWRPAGRAAATPDPPRTVLDPETGIEEPVTTGRIPDAEFVEPPLMPPAASPDERLREALRDLAEAARPYVERAAPDEKLWDEQDYRNFLRLAMALAVADREAPDEET